MTNDVIRKGADTGCAPSNTTWASTVILFFNAIPTAPELYISRLWNKVTGLPVIKGVDPAMSPSCVTGFIDEWSRE